MKKIDVIYKLLSCACMLMLISACKSDETNAMNLKSINKIEVAEDNLESQETVTYLAVIKSMNTNVAGNVTGSFTFHKDQEFMVADVRIIGSAPNIIHAQNVYTGTECPTETADKNQDGIIDILEAQKITENVIIPLDGDINNQYSLLGMYPVSDEWGAFFYSQTASFQLFMNDLKAVDENLDDEIIKIQASPFGLAGKVVMIYGIADEVTLPESVNTNGGFTANQTIPVACGVISRITEVPGSFEPDDLPVGTVVNHSSHTNSGRTNGRSSPMRSRHNGTSGDGTNYQGQCQGHGGKDC